MPTKIADCPKPGIYEGVPFETYCEWDAVNNSSLSALKRSPAHYLEAINQDYDSEALRFGRFLHDSSLDPGLLMNRYVIEPDLTSGIDSTRPKATKLYKERRESFLQSIGDKELVPAEWFQTTQQILISLYQNQRANEYLAHTGPAEVTIVWEEPTTGLRCKSRIDKWDRSRGRVIDLKSTQDACDFNRTIGKYGYHRQAAFYLDAVVAVTGEWESFCFVAIEKTAPFAVRAAPLDDDSISAGRDEYRRLLQILAECRESGCYPKPDNPDYFRCPAWAMEPDEIELTVGGETVRI